MNLYQPTISGSLTVSGSVVVNGTIVMTSGSISGTASLAENSLLLGGLNSGSFQSTSSFSSFSSSLSGRLVTDETNIATNTAASSSFAAQSASLSTRLTTDESNFTNLSSSFATTSGSISERVTIIEGQDATTGSNVFTGTQYVNQASNAISFTSTASLYTDGGLRVAKDSFVSGTAYFNNITVYGTSSIQYITSSQVNIGSNIITVNTDTPAIRFGGLSVFDSGSTQLTGSIFWDSEKNHWIYSNPSGSTYNSGMLISGPRNSGSLGSEEGTTFNALMKGQGGDHITSSQMFDDGTTVRIPGNLQVTGSIVVASSITTGASILGYTAGLSAYKTYSKAAQFEISSYQSVNGSPFTKTMDIVSNADSGVPSEMRFLTADSGSNPTTRLTISSTGAATFTSLPAGYGITLNHTSENLRLKMGAVAGGIINIQGEVISSGGVYPIILNYLGGNVGIGTTALVSDSLLPIQINAGASSQAYFASNNNGSYGLLMGYDNVNGYARIRNVSNTALTFETNNSEKMRLTASGNLGLGVTPSVWGGSYKAVQIANSALWSATNDLHLTLNILYDGAYKYIDSGYASRYNQYLGQHIWYNAPSGTAGAAITFTQAMTLDSSGRLGIGDASPQSGVYIAKYGSNWDGDVQYNKPTGNIFLSMGYSVSNEDNWFGIRGNYGSSSGTANILLQANYRDVGSQAGHYITSKATALGIADFEIGKLTTSTSVSTPPTKVPQLSIASSGNATFVGSVTAAGSGGRSVVLTGQGAGQVAINGDNSTYATSIVFNSQAGGTTLTGIWAYGSGTTLNWLGIGGTAYNSAAIYIPPSGNVGIGNSGPAAKLHNRGSFITENSSGAQYGEAKSFIYQSAFNNPTINLLTINTSSAYGATIIKVTVYQNTVSSGLCNIHVGYAYWAGNPYPTVSKGVSGPTLEVSFNGGTNVGTLAWSGNTLQYTSNRMTNYDGYAIVVEWGANVDANAAPTYGGNLQ